MSRWLIQVGLRPWMAVSPRGLILGGWGSVGTDPKRNRKPAPPHVDGVTEAWCFANQVAGEGGGQGYSAS